MKTDTTDTECRCVQGSERRVLIVDDEAAHRKRYCTVLAAEGFACEAAEAAESARAILRSTSYDILVADIVMPGGSGLDLAADVQVSSRDMAVIMVTGIDDPAVYKRAADLGVYGYLIKPVTNNQLRATVQSAWIRLTLERERVKQTQLLEKLVKQRDETVAALETANLKIHEQQAHLVKQERLSALLQFAGATAHEINQPLMVIFGHIEMMAMDRGSTDKLEAHVAKIQAASEQISHIVKKIQRLRTDTVIRLNEHDSIIDLGN